MNGLNKIIKKGMPGLEPGSFRAKATRKTKYNDPYNTFPYKK